MRLLITTQVFPPEIHPTAVMAAELASGLVRRGWEITVATGLPHHPTGAVPAAYRRRLRQVERVEGYEVLRHWHPTTPNRSIPARAAVMSTQAVATGAAAMSAARPDLVLSFGGPPLVGPVISGLVARMRGVPLVTVIHDIYPDVAIESGALRNPIGIRIARWLERWQYSMSSAVVVLGETTRRLVVAAGGYPPDRVHVVPVWLDPDEIRPGPRDNGWRRSVGIRPDEFVVLYSGTAGIISGAEVLAKVAAHLPPDVVVVLVGGGSAWNTLDGLRTRGRLPGNLRLLPYQPRERLAEVQAASDLSVLTLLPGRGRTSVPSKLQGYMAAGRPVLIAADEDCDTAELVRKERIGRIAPPGDDRAFAKAIVEFRADRAELEACGRRARAAFEAMHARDPLLDRYSQLLREVVDEARKC